MELHKALRNIIQTEGTDILKDVRLVNILDDFHAYVDIPSAKYILRAMIADGFMQKILNIGEWNNESRQLIGKFISNTGFSSELVETIFEALVYGLGWAEGNLSLENKEGETLRNSLEKSEHMKFMGIPIAGSPKDFVSRLKDKGFKVISKKKVKEFEEANEYGMSILYDSNYIHLKGNFALFDDCLIQVGFSSYTKEVYSVSVFPPLYMGWLLRKFEFDKIKELLIRKYGQPLPPSYPDSDIVTYEVKEGSITMELDGDSTSDEIDTFEITYTDNIGSRKHDYEKDIVIEEDL